MSKLSNKKEQLEISQRNTQLCEESLKKELTGDKQKNVEECEICKKEDLSIFRNYLMVYPDKEEVDNFN